MQTVSSVGVRTCPKNQLVNGNISFCIADMPKCKNTSHDPDECCTVFMLCYNVEVWCSKSSSLKRSEEDRTMAKTTWNVLPDKILFANSFLVKIKNYYQLLITVTRLNYTCICTEFHNTKFVLLYSGRTPMYFVHCAVVSTTAQWTIYYCTVEITTAQ